MGKFKVHKTFDLGFLGDEWSDGGAYLKFTPFTVRDLYEAFPKMANAEVDTNDSNSVSENVTKTVNLLKDHFVEGKGIGEDGKVIDIKADDLNELPAEILTKAVNFLSQGIANETTTS